MDSFAGSGMIRPGSGRSWGVITPVGKDLDTRLFSYVNDSTRNRVQYRNDAEFNVHGIKQSLSYVNGVSSNFIMFPEGLYVESENSRTASKKYNQGDQVFLSGGEWNDEIVENPSFSDSASNWARARCTVDVTDGIATVTSNDDDDKGDGYIYQNIVSKLVANAEYIFHIETGDLPGFAEVTHTSGMGNKTLEANSSYDFEFKCNFNSGTNEIRLRALDDNPSSFKNISIIQKSNQQAVFIMPSESGEKLDGPLKLNVTKDTSRKDLVFLETWHEKVSEKDFVYPWGNVQYTSGNRDGLSGLDVGTFDGVERYSLFGEWQEDNELVGKGYKWSTLSAAKKRDFMKNPLNNMYKDGSDVYQVRYRVRVVNGLGNNISNLSITSRIIGGSAVRYANGKGYLEFKGKKTSIPQDHQSHDNGKIIYSGSNNKIQYDGSFANGHSSITDGEYCYATILFTAQRRNEGIYHPVFNQEGCGKYYNSDTNTSMEWWELGDIINSKTQCFNKSLMCTFDGGNYSNYHESDEDYYLIGKAETRLSGRPDGFFVDHIHERDIEDLRMHAQPIEDYSDFLSRQINDYSAGKMRGVQASERMIVADGTASSSLSRFYISRKNSHEEVESAYPMLVLEKGDSDYNIGDTTSLTAMLHRYNGTTNYIVIGNRGGLTNGTVGMKFLTHSSNGEYIQSSSNTRTGYTSNGKVLVCDIFGVMNNYPQQWKDNGVFGKVVIQNSFGESQLPGDLVHHNVSNKTHAYIDFGLNRQKKYIKYAVIDNSEGTFYCPKGNASSEFKLEDKSGIYNDVRVSFGSDWSDELINESIIRIFYETIAEVSIDAPCEPLYSISDITAESNYNGSALIANYDLLKKAGYGHTGINSGHLRGIKLKTCALNSSNKLMAADNVDYIKPSHEIINPVNSVADKAICVKYFGSLVQKDKNRAALQIMFNEMKYKSFSNTSFTNVYTDDVIPTVTKGDLFKLNQSSIKFNGAEYPVVDGTVTIEDEQDDGTSSTETYSVENGKIVINDQIIDTIEVEHLLVAKLNRNSAGVWKDLIISGNNIYDSSYNPIKFVALWDGNGWGDNSEFKISGDVHSFKDDNDNNVLYGTKEIRLNYFIDNKFNRRM